MMERIKIRPVTRYTQDIKRLYEECGWTNYTRDAQLLEHAVKHSLCTLGAYDGNTLIGLARAVGDGFSILYIQDLLLLSAYRRRGIGSNLLQALVMRYPRVYQTVLMADDTDELRSFYEMNGLKAADEMNIRTYVKIRPPQG